MDDCFSAPTTGVPGRTVALLDRVSDDYNLTFKYTGGRTRGLNISSYNYLGFAQARGGCADAVEDGMRRYGVAVGGARREGGTSELHVQAEALVARFVGQDDALISSMGFATNSTIIPALVSKGCLVISDELNHASIRFGVRLSGANVRMFKHNNMKNLEKLLREVISQGQPKTHRPWKKILIIVEGLYSMEGTLVNLPALIELKKRYKVISTSCYPVLSYILIFNGSSTYSSTKPTPLVRLVHTGVVLPTTSISLHGRSTFIWAPSRNHLALQVATSQAASN